MLLVGGLLLLGVAIILHHRVKHHHDLKGWRRWMQLKDIDNHETLVIFLLGVAVGRAATLLFIQ